MSGMPSTETTESTEVKKPQPALTPEKIKFLAVLLHTAILNCRFIRLTNGKVFVYNQAKYSAIN